MSFVVAAFIAVAVLIAGSAVADPMIRRSPIERSESPRSAWWGVVRERWSSQARRDREVSPGALGDWADRVSRNIRHGTSLHAALRSITPEDATLATLSAPLRHHLDRGTAVEDACDEWSDRLATCDVARVDLLVTFAAVLGAAAAVGGSAAEPIDRLAAAMRRHVSADREREAQSAQAKMSASVLTIVPLVVLTLLVSSDDDVRAVVGEPAGLAVVAVGLSCNALGGLWMRRIVRGPR